MTTAVQVLLKETTDTSAPGAKDKQKQRSMTFRNECNMTIKRYFSDNAALKIIKQDFAFLVRIVNESYGEFDIALRNDYFNIYYKGNSLAKIRPIRGSAYRISIHEKFFKGTKAAMKFKAPQPKNKYCTMDISRGALHQFLQKSHLAEFASRIKKVNNGEEIDFEQALITDNMNRSDFFFIDRQITDTLLKRRRLDLLAMKQIKGNKYSFVISEVKLGNNPELKDKVAAQLDNYVSHVEKYFSDYKECYEMQFKQKRELGLLDKPGFEEIEIVKPVIGVIIVGHYSGQAHKYISVLKEKHKNLCIIPLKNTISAESIGTRT